MLALVIGELFFRFFHKESVDNRPLKNSIHMASDNLKLFYRLAPGASTNADGVSYRVNRHGFRDGEYSLAKSKEIKQIVFLGDSIVFGLGLENNETLPNQLEQIFKEKGEEVEVLNFGVTGYETEQEVELFKETGLNFKPDAVIVGYCLNDSMQASGELLHLHDLKHTVKTQHHRLYKRALSYLYRYSRLMAFLDRRFQIQRRYKFFRSYEEEPVYGYIETRNKINQDKDDSPYRLLKAKILQDARRLQIPDQTVSDLMRTIGMDGSDFFASRWNISKKSFQELKDLSQQHSFRAIVVIFPIFDVVDRYPLSSLHEFIREELEEMGFFVIDLLDWGKQVCLGYGRPAISKDGVHFSPLGATLAARYIYEELTSGELLT